MRFVLDASVAVRWYLLDESDEKSDAVLARVIEEPELFAVPELFFFEVLAVLGRSHPKPLQTYTEAFLPVTESSLFRHPMTVALAGQCDRFIAQGLTGYDACYAALAAELGAKWLTFDSRAHQIIAREDLSVDLAQGFPPDW